jgi:hypothetical protein
MSCKKEEKQLQVKLLHGVCMKGLLVYMHARAKGY